MFDFEVFLFRINVVYVVASFLTAGVLMFSKIY